MRQVARHILLSILISSSFALQAQENTYRFENISEVLGQLHFNINQFHEDQLGYLWIGTDDGLYRYDGYELEGYVHDPFDSTSLSSRSVHYIVEDHDGRLWAEPAPTRGTVFTFTLPAAEAHARAVTLGAAPP